MLVNMKEMLQDAEKHNYAIGSLNTPNLETLRAVIAAAEELGCPVIINHAQGHEPVVAMEVIAPLMKMYAEQARVPVAMHIDHGLDLNFCMKAVRAGFTSIMCDKSEYPLEENIALTRQFVELVSPLGITVEAELGAMPNNMPCEVPGQEQSDLSDLSVYFTKVDEAKQFAEETGVDVLAVSVGTVHGLYKAKSDLDIARIEAIRKELEGTGTYLGMHGCSGTEPDQVVAAVNAGIRKINYFTAMDTGVTPAIQKMIDDYAGRPLNYSLMVNTAMEELKKGAKKALELFMTCKK